MSVRFSREGRIAIITLDRPEKLNAMTPEMYADITRRLQEVDADDGIWVAIVTGAGTRAFSAGADLTTVHRPQAGPGVSWQPLRQERFDLGLQVSKPLIAAIEGYCLAGGLELALCCDIRIAGEGARFGCPEVRWNVLHGYGALALPRLIGLSRALYLLLTGEFVDAQEALRLGLVHEVVPQGEALERARALAERICRNAPLAVRMTKELALRSFEVPLSDGLRLYSEFRRLLQMSEDQAEGTRAFQERREPRFQGR